MALLKAHAIENPAYIVACNRVGKDPNVSYSGDSMIIDYNGKILAHEKYNEAILYEILDKMLK